MNPDTTTIIALSGLNGAGKDTVAEALKAIIPGSQICPFAAYVKTMATENGWDGLKDEPGRRLLEDLTMLWETYRPGYWARAWRARHLATKVTWPYIIVPDERGIGGPEGELAKLIAAHGGWRFTIKRKPAEVSLAPINLTLHQWDMAARAAGIPIDNSANDHGAAAAAEIWRQVKAKMDATP